MCTSTVIAYKNHHCCFISVWPPHPLEVFKPLNRDFRRHCRFHFSLKCNIDFKKQVVPPHRQSKQKQILGLTSPCCCSWFSATKKPSVKSMCFLSELAHAWYQSTWLVMWHALSCVLVWMKNTFDTYLKPFKTHNVLMWMKAEASRPLTLKISGCVRLSLHHCLSADLCSASLWCVSSKTGLITKSVWKLYELLKTCVIDWFDVNDDNKQPHPTAQLLYVPPIWCSITALIWRF